MSEEETFPNSYHLYQQERSNGLVWKLSLSAELPKVRILSSAMATLGGQRILFESVSRLGYCHLMVISLFSFVRFSEASAFIRTSSFQKLPTGLQSSSDSHVYPLLLAAITDMLHPFSDTHFFRCQ